MDGTRFDAAGLARAALSSAFDFLLAASLVAVPTLAVAEAVELARTLTRPVAKPACINPATGRDDVR